MSHGLEVMEINCNLSHQEIAEILPKLASPIFAVFQLYRGVNKYYELISILTRPYK
jgi:hypothetical protein